MYPVLETEKLLLRPFQEDDIDAMFHLCSNSKLTKPVDWLLAKNKEQAEDFLKIIMDCKMYWAIVFKPENKIIGVYGFNHIALKTAKKREKTFIWFLVDEEYQNKGIEKEATKKVLHFAFFGAKTKLIGANKNNYIHNAAAIKALEECGFVQFNLSKNNYDALNAYGDNENQIYQHNPPVSPHSYNKPVRKIDGIIYIKQPTEYLCGQAVIAMLANVSVDDIIEVMQNDKGAGTPLMREALEYYGIKAKKRIYYTDGVQLPECCILSLKLPGYGHWSLYYKGTYYDPEFGESNEIPINAKLIAYMEIAN